jgi:hypothetical protein
MVKIANPILDRGTGGNLDIDQSLSREAQGSSHSIWGGGTLGGAIVSGSHMCPEGLAGVFRWTPSVGSRP